MNSDESADEFDLLNVYFSEDFRIFNAAFKIFYWQILVFSFEQVRDFRRNGAAGLSEVIVNSILNKFHVEIQVDFRSRKEDVKREWKYAFASSIES